MKTYTIDRFEGDLAMLETDSRQIVEIPRSALPAGAKEGDVVREEDGRFWIDKEETARLREQTRRLEDELWG